MIWKIVECIAYLGAGLQLPSQFQTRNPQIFFYYEHSTQQHHQASSRNSNTGLAIVLGHGLGTPDPRIKSHTHDHMIALANKGTNISQKLESTILYTARGHGASMGWQETAESDLSQFSWERQADDMLGIAHYFGYNQAIFGGFSMGAMSALFVAVKYPEKVKGLILIKPPAGWRARENRKHHVLLLGKQLKEKEKDGELYHNVLIGSTIADYPPFEDIDKVKCPVLILSLPDDAHPESSAKVLHEHMPHSELHITNNITEADRVWPTIIREFIDKIN